MILPDVRASFKRDDAARLVQLLARDGEDPGHLETLVAERGIDALLDHPKAARSLVREPGVSRLPLALFSYVALRRSLLDGGVESRLLADYVTSIFLHFASEARVHRIAEQGPGGSTRCPRRLWERRSKRLRRGTLTGSTSERCSQRAHGGAGRRGVLIYARPG